VADRSARILLVDDEQSIQTLLSYPLRKEGYDVVQATDGRQALDRFDEQAFDLVVLDLMLPKVDGLEVCRRLRNRSSVPIIILTAKSEEIDKVVGLELGADDYITKPFDLEEFLARVQAVLRRARPPVEQLVLGRVVIDFRAQTATRAGYTLHLTHREFELAEYLAERQERVVHRNELLREVWGYLEVPSTRSVDHAIARLRKKIEPDPHHPRFIHTVHGDGYCLTPAGASGVFPGDPE